MAIEGEQASRYETKLKRELGDIVLGALAEVATEDILLNPDGRLWVNARGGFREIGRMSASSALAAIGTIAAWRGTTINHDNPVLETELPLDGSRFEGLVPPIVRAPSFAIRVRPRSIFTLDQYEEAGIITSKDDLGNTSTRNPRAFIDSVAGMSHTEIIREAVRNKKNILLVGATGSGKTTLANAVLHCMGQVAPDDRIVIIEDTTELQCFQTNYVDLRAFGNVSMLTCLRVAMRMKPKRIVVGEVRGPEAHALMKAWNTGHPGGAATVHANDAMGGLYRVESLLSETVAAPQQTLIAEAVDLAVFIDEDDRVRAGRKVREVLAVTGFDAERQKYLTTYL